MGTNKTYKSVVEGLEFRIQLVIADTDLSRSE